MTDNNTAIIPPKPDDLAVAFAAALMMTGKYESPGAAIHAAWAAVPEFYLGRKMYAEQIAPMFFVPVDSETERAHEIFGTEGDPHI